MGSQYTSRQVLCCSSCKTRAHIGAVNRWCFSLFTLPSQKNNTHARTHTSTIPTNNIAKMCSIQPAVRESSSDLVSLYTSGHRKKLKQSDVGQEPGLCQPK